MNATPSALVKFLRGVPAFTLQTKAYMFERFMRNPLPFKPIVDGGLVEDPILPLEPTELLATGAWNKVPVILGHNKDEGLLAKGFFQHIGGRQRRNWIELALLSFFGRENLEEATLEEIEEVVNLHSTNLTSIRVIVGYPVQKAVSWEGNGHWVSLGQDVRGHSVQDTDKQSCPSTCLSAWPTNILLPLHSSGSLFGSCPRFCPCPCLQLIFISHFTSTRAPSPSTTVSTFPLSNFSSKSLAFASGSTGSGPTLPWTGFAGVFMCYKHRQKRWFQTFIQGPTTGFVMLTSCSCCSSLTKCLSRWCAAMLTSGWENPS